MIAQVVIHQRTETCVSRNDFCPDWIRDHIGDYVDPLVRHVELVIVSVAIGFAIAFTLALLAHRRRWLVGPFTAITGVLYTIPSIVLFTVLQAILGFGFFVGVIPLVAYTLIIIFRNTVTGLANVPEETRDAARGMGLTERQLLWRVELPLAVPEIVAGVRIATVTNVALATLAFFAGAGGLGAQILTDIAFKSNIVVAGGLTVLLAFAFDAVLLVAQRSLVPWRRVAH